MNACTIWQCLLLKSTGQTCFSDHLSTKTTFFPPWKWFLIETCTKGTCLQRPAFVFSLGQSLQTGLTVYQTIHVPTSNLLSKTLPFAALVPYVNVTFFRLVYLRLRSSWIFRILAFPYWLFCHRISKYIEVMWSWTYQSASSIWWKVVYETDYETFLLFHLSVPPPFFLSCLSCLSVCPNKFLISAWTIIQEMYTI